MRVLRGFAVIVAVVLAFGCSSSREKAPLVEADYREWVRTTEKVLDYPIPGHLDNLRVIYVNEPGEEPVIREVAGRQVYAYPEGTVFLKEVYDGTTPAEGRAPQALTIMLKSSEHPKAIRGWVWLTKNPTTGEETVVSEPFCATCHAQANQSHPYGDSNPENEDRDCVFILYSPKEDSP